MSQRIGVLALQGNYTLHQKALEALSVDAPLIYKPHELINCDGLIIPGGESTALLRLMTPLNWQTAIRDFKSNHKKIFGTCAGMILCAHDVTPEQETLALIDITVSRNAYGRQLDSHVAKGQCHTASLGADELEMVFIRAPKVTRVGSAVTVHATCGGVPVLVQQDNVLCASFHPEFLPSATVHRYFIEQLEPEG